jgi:hypothetical protein
MFKIKSIAGFLKAHKTFEGEIDTRDILLVFNKNFTL